MDITGHNNLMVWNNIWPYWLCNLHIMDKKLLKRINKGKKPEPRKYIEPNKLQLFKYLNNLTYYKGKDNKRLYDQLALWIFINNHAKN